MLHHPLILRCCCAAPRYRGRLSDPIFQCLCERTNYQLLNVHRPDLEFPIVLALRLQPREGHHANDVRLQVENRGPCGTCLTMGKHDVRCKLSLARNDMSKGRILYIAGT